MRKWESEKHKSWGMPAEGFKGHVATDGSLLVNAGKWGACGSAVVQLDKNVEMGPLHGMYGSIEAEFEVQRTIKRAELRAFLCFLKKVCGPIKIHVDNKGIIDGLRKGEKECIKPKSQKRRDILVEVEHVKAHRTKKEKEKMTKIERFVTEGNEKADELAKAGAMLDEGLMAEVRAVTMKQERPLPLEDSSEWISDARKALTSISMIICDGTFPVENLTRFQYFASGTCRYFFELVTCWMLRELASEGVWVEFDSTVTRTGTLS